MASRKSDAGVEVRQEIEAIERVASTALAPAGVATEPMRLIEDADTGDRFLVYQNTQGVDIDLIVDGQTFWATQAQMAGMFGINVPGISKHLKNIFAESELVEDSVVSIKEITAADGKVYRTKVYDLNAVISVGYRVESRQGTMFRVWATDKLFRYLTKGFVVDVRRLKEGGDASRLAEFRELARDIRSEQRNVHDELATLCTYCQDYDAQSPDSRQFFQHSSAKIFYAATNKTPSEVIFERADALREHMGLSTWPSFPRPLSKRHVTVAKNYLDMRELEALNRFSALLLDFMEDQAKEGRLATIAEAATKIDEFTKFTGRIPLSGGGSRSRTQADEKALTEWEKFKAHRLERQRELADHATPDQIEAPRPARRPRAKKAAE